MLDLLNTLFRSLSPLWEMSVTAAYAAAVVIVLRLLLKKRAPRQVLCLLWLVVFARLLIPVSLESPLSIVPDALPGQEYIADQAPGRAGDGDPVTSNVSQNAVPNQPQTQPGNDTVKPVTGGLNPSLSVPEGVRPAAPEAPAAFHWQAAVAGVWLAGAVTMGGYALVSYLRMRRRLFDAIRAGDGVWEHPDVDSPFILGVLRPRIYLPAGLTGQPRQFILCHERAHLRRFDHIVKPVCWAALALHWFNPLVWAAFLLMSRDIESACDEAVVLQLGSGIKADYSDTLLALATGRRFPAPCPLAFDEGDAKGRIRNVLSYRRPALWAVVISVAAAALAAVCLLTDPVAAKAEGDPDPDAVSSLDPDVSGSQNAEGLNSLLDPWMKAVLGGERDFLMEGTGNLTVDQLFEAIYGTDLDFQLRVTVSKVAIIDLDRDGIKEIVVWPSINGDDSLEAVSIPGYLILRRQGDMVYGYNPNYRGFNQLKADGTFHWSNSAFNNGVGSTQFTEHGFEVKYVTWCDTDSEHNPLFFVDGRKATGEEFEAAIAAQDAKPEPTWYVYKNGVLGTDAEYPLDRNLDLNGNGVPETVQIMELDGGRRLELWESDKLIFTEEGYYAHAGYNSMFLCTLDGKDYLLRYHPNGAQGWCHYSYELFTLTRNGQEKVIQENSVKFDINFGPMHESFDPEALAAFMDEINSLLTNSVQLINTNDELLGTFQKEGRLYDSLSWLDLWAPVYVRNETASLLENLRTFQASMEIAKDYPSVLLGKSKFVLYQDEQTSSLASIDDVPALISKDDPYVKISDFTVVDMDGDGTDDVLVWVCGVTTDFSGYLLLRQENGTIYGTIFDAHNHWSNRWFSDLKTDGTFECHDVVDRWHSISKLFFTAGGGTGIYGLTVIRNDPDYDLESFMAVQKEVTREKDWWAAVDAQKEKPDAVWYEFNEENIAEVFMKG